MQVQVQAQVQAQAQAQADLHLLTQCANAPTQGHGVQRRQLLIEVESSLKLRLHS